MSAQSQFVHNGQENQENIQQVHKIVTSSNAVPPQVDASSVDGSNKFEGRKPSNILSAPWPYWKYPDFKAAVSGSSTDKAPLNNYRQHNNGQNYGRNNGYNHVQNNGQQYYNRSNRGQYRGGRGGHYNRGGYSNRNYNGNGSNWTRNRNQYQQYPSNGYGGNCYESNAALLAQYRDKAIENQAQFEELQSQDPTGTYRKNSPTLLKEAEEIANHYRKRMSSNLVEALVSNQCFYHADQKTDEILINHHPTTGMSYIMRKDQDSSAKVDGQGTSSPDTASD